MDPVLEAAIGNPRIAGPYDSDTKYRVGNVPDDDVPDDDDTPVGVDGRRKDRAADYAVVVNGLVCTPPRSDQGADQNDLYNPRYRRARDGVLVNSDDSRIDFCDNGPEGDNGKDRHARIDKIEAEYHAAVKRGERHKRLDTGFPLLRAIRKRDGNVVQSGDNRKMFEAIALMLRGDFAIATGDVRSRLDDNPSFEPGEVDYSNKYDPTAFPDGPPAMGAAQREKMSVETITYTDPRTGAVWSGDVPSMVNAGVQQARAERRVWALLPTAEPSGWRRSHKSRVSSSGPVSHTGPAEWSLEPETYSTEITRETMPDGKKADIIWRITHQRQIRTDAAGTSIWHMKTWTPPDGYDGSVGKEWRLVRQTIASAVDNGGDDPVRDEMPSQRRIPAQQRLSILLDCLGADLFGTARMSCHEDMDLGEIGLSMGVGTGARCGAAAARECRVVLRRAIEVYRAIAVAEQRDTGTPASWWADIGSVATIAKKKGKSPVRAAKTTETGGQAANDNTHRRQKAA